jgi:GntR family transcriptional regulator/MocR family aminotransferase
VAVSRTSSAELFVHLDGAGPLTTQLERALRAAVRSGRLADGTRLPSTRGLAAELGVSRGVVVSAYAQLGAEGYLSVRQGAPVRVAAAAPRDESSEAVERRIGRPPRYNLRPDLPDYSAFPRREWLASMRAALRDATDEELGYGDARGAPQLREALAAYLGRVRGLSARPGRVVVTVGFAHGIDLVCAALRARGARRIAVEDPGHVTVRRIVEHSGLAAVPVPVDAEGLRVDALDADAALVTPAHQFPTGVVLSPERRAALLAWAEARDALILEDDFDAEFRYDRPPVGALQGLAPERVVYLGSVSKTLAPALRIGWAVLPSWLGAAVAEQVEGTILAAPRLDQLALAHFVGRGELDRHLRRMRLRYRRRRDALLDALTARLPQARPEGVAAGLHVIARLPAEWDERAVLAGARARGIALAGMGEYRFDGRAEPPTLLLGYARSPEPVLRAAVRELAASVSSL